MLFPQGRLKGAGSVKEKENRESVFRQYLGVVGFFFFLVCPKLIHPLSLEAASPLHASETSVISPVLYLLLKFNYSEALRRMPLTRISSLPSLLITAWDSPSLAFLMMYSAYKLNKQGDNKQPWCSRFPILNQFVATCPVLTATSWPAYRFLRKRVRWSDIPIFLKILHSLLWSTRSKALV